MKSATLVTTLTTLTKAMALAAPFVVFGFLYVLKVEPQHAASDEAREQLEAARGELNRQRALARSPVAATTTSALDEFERSTAEGDRLGEVANSIKAALSSPAVGGVSNLLIATGEPDDGPIDSIVGPLPPRVWHTRVTVTFDAQYEQVGRFLSILRALPTTFDLRAVDLRQQLGLRPGLMRAQILLLVFHRAPLAKQPSRMAGGNRAVAPPSHPDPVVTGILVSDGRRVALIDGRLVRTGDRLQTGVVQSIEPDTVVIAASGGQLRRLKIERP